MAPQPNKPIQHTNPDYYAETASLYGAPSQPPRPQGQQQQQQHQQPQYQQPQYQQPQHQQPQYQQPQYQQPQYQQPQYQQPQYQQPQYQQPQYQQPQYQQPAYPPQYQQQAPQFAPPPTQEKPPAGAGYAGAGYAQQPNSPRPSSSSSASNSTSSNPNAKPSMRERLYQMSVKVGGPINRLTNKLGSEAFFPSSLDLECDKAARILNSFCQDGFYTTPPAGPSGSGAPASPGPKGKPGKALVKIPSKVIQSAAGLAIFTTFRTGLHISGAGGSGVVVARLPDGGWSPPAGFLVHTLGAGFLVGLDIYDCVCVLRTPKAVEAFTRPRVSLGGEVGLVAGPVGAGASVEAALLAKSGPSARPIWSYMKSRGFYAGVQADGTIIVGRPDANAELYRQKGISVEQILRGQVPAPSPGPADGSKVPPWPVATRHLMEVLKAAEGRPDVNRDLLQEVAKGPTPGDLAETEHESQHEGQPPQYYDEKGRYGA